MRIVQMNSVLFYGDAISNVMRANDEIFKENGWQSDLIVDLFSEIPGISVMAYKDYTKDPLIEQFTGMLSRFIRLDKKLLYLKLFLRDMKKYKHNIAKEKIENADIRIWHYGSFYTMFEYFHEKDILFYYGLTYPYLTNFAKSMLFSKNMLQAILDMQPFVIVESSFIKQGLIDLGFKPSSIHILPLYHKLPIQKHTLSDKAKPKLLTWGRYATNKQVPQLASFCAEHNINFTAFGDNFQTKEYASNYREAKKYENEHVHILTKQKEFLPFVQSHDIFISNSLHEGFLMPAIEAASQGLPLLIRKGTAPDDFFRQGFKPGFQFTSLDEIPALIEEIMKDYDYYSEQANKLASLYTFDIYEKNLLGLISKYLKFKG